MDVPEDLCWGDMSEEQRAIVRMWFALNLPMQAHISSGWDYDQSGWIIRELRKQLNEGKELDQNWKIRLKR